MLELWPEEARDVGDLGLEYDVLGGPGLLDLGAHDLKELFEVDGLVLSLVDEVLRAGAVAGAVAVVVAVAVVLETVRVAGLAAADDGVALDGLGLDAQTPRPVVVLVNLIESIVNVRVSVGDVLQLVLPLLVYQGPARLRVPDQPRDVLPRESRQLLQLANLDLVAHRLLVLVPQTLERVLDVQHVLLRDALPHVRARVEGANGERATT